MIVCEADQATGIAGGLDWSTRCSGKSVALCLELANEDEIAQFRTVPKHLGRDNRISIDPLMNAAKFSVPPRSPADTSGQLHIQFPEAMRDVYVAFDVYYPQEFLDASFRSSGGWKTFILGQGKQGCAPHEVVGVNGYFKGYPQFYYSCHKFLGVMVHNPFGNDANEFDYQPGADSQCLRHGVPARGGCAMFVGDQWTTFQIHVNTWAKWLEVWMTVEGRKTRKIIDHPLDDLPDEVWYEWIKLTPYQTGKSANEAHPAYALWHRRLIVSGEKIPHPKN